MKLVFLILATLYFIFTVIALSKGSLNYALVTSIELTVSLAAAAIIHELEKKK